jgi:predicted transcriptional regulator
MSHTLTIRIQDDLAHWLEQTARETGISQGKLVRDELERARRSNAHGKRFLRLAGAVKGDPRLSERQGFSKS